MWIETICKSLSKLLFPKGFKFQFHYKESKTEHYKCFVSVIYSKKPLKN